MPNTKIAVIGLGYVGFPLSIELSKQFKTIGYVPAKVSKTSWKSFREVGTEFMRKKNTRISILKSILHETF